MSLYAVSCSVNKWRKYTSEMLPQFLYTYNDIFHFGLYGELILGKTSKNMKLPFNTFEIPWDNPSDIFPRNKSNYLHDKNSNIQDK